MDYRKQFIEWCNQNKVLAKPTDTMFFIDETITLKPLFILNYHTYVDFVTSTDDMSDKLVNAYKAFQESYGKIIVIPASTVSELHKITKEDLEDRFNISL